MKRWVIKDNKGMRIVIGLSSATFHEATLIEPTLSTIRSRRIGAGRPRTKIKRLIHDSAANYT